MKSITESQDRWNFIVPSICDACDVIFELCMCLIWKKNKKYCYSSKERYHLITGYPPLNLLASFYTTAEKHNHSYKQAPVVWKEDYLIHWINLYLLEREVCFIDTSQLESDLSFG